MWFFVNVERLILTRVYDTRIFGNFHDLIHQRVLKSRVNLSEISIRLTQAYQLC